MSEYEAVWGGLELAVVTAQSGWGEEAVSHRVSLHGGFVVLKLRSGSRVTR